MVRNVLALAAGIGGLELGVRLAVPESRVLAYVERDAYCAAALLARMENKTLEPAPIFCGDLRDFDAIPFAGVDLVTAGYPCQPFSCAGKKKGADDPRHLWPAIKRVVRDVRPSLCFFENVPNHLNLGFREVCEDLWSLGYGVEAGIFSAEEVGAPHLRKRLFILAHSEHGPRNEPGRRNGPSRACAAEPERYGPPVAHPPQLTKREQNNEASPEPREGSRLNACGGSDGTCGGKELAHPHGCGDDWPTWPPGPDGDWDGIPQGAQPAVRRVADGAAHRVERLRALGNAVVPAVAAKAFLTLLGQST